MIINVNGTLKHRVLYHFSSLAIFEVSWSTPSRHIDKHQFFSTDPTQSIINGMLMETKTNVTLSLFLKAML